MSELSDDSNGVANTSSMSSESDELHTSGLGTVLRGGRLGVKGCW